MRRCEVGVRAGRVALMFKHLTYNNLNKGKREMFMKNAVNVCA